MNLGQNFWNMYSILKFLTLIGDGRCTTEWDFLLLMGSKAPEATSESDIRNWQG